MLRRAIIKKGMNGLGIIGAGSLAFKADVWSRGLLWPLQQRTGEN